MICGGFHAATAKAKGTLATKQYPWSFPGTPVVRRQGVINHAHPRGGWSWKAGDVNG